VLSRAKDKVAYNKRAKGEPRCDGRNGQGGQDFHLVKPFFAAVATGKFFGGFFYAVPVALL
jgi:hypothetical protein